MQYYKNFAEMYDGQLDSSGNLSIFNGFREDLESSFRAKYPDLEIEFDKLRGMYRIRLTEQADNCYRQMSKRIGHKQLPDIFPHTTMVKYGGGYSLDFCVNSSRSAISPDRTTVVVPVEIAHNIECNRKRIRSYVTLPYDSVIKSGYDDIDSLDSIKVAYDQCCELADQLGVFDKIFESCDKVENELAEIRKRLGNNYFRVEASDSPTKLVPTVDTFRTADYLDVPNPQYDSSYID